MNRLTALLITKHFRALLETARQDHAHGKEMIYPGKNRIAKLLSFLLIVGGGAWSLDAWLARRKTTHD